MTGGKCGRNVTWLLSGNTLVISGTGEMNDYVSAPDRFVWPWKNVRKLVKKIIVNDGVTTIGNFAFVDFVNLSDVIVDIVETGSTLRENGLEVLEEICPLSARMIVNQVSMQMETERIRKLINDIKENLE